MLQNDTIIPTDGVLRAIRFVQPNRNMAFRLRQGYDWHWSVEFRLKEVVIHMPENYPVFSRPEEFGGGFSRLWFNTPEELVVYAVSLAHWRRKIDFTTFIPKSGKFLSPAEFLRGAGAARMKRNKVAWKKAIYNIREWRKLVKATQKKAPPETPSPVPSANPSACISVPIHNNAHAPTTVDPASGTRPEAEPAQASLSTFHS